MVVMVTIQKLFNILETSKDGPDTPTKLEVFRANGSWISRGVH